VDEDSVSLFARQLAGDTELNEHIHGRRSSIRPSSLRNLPGRKVAFWV
jgi:hypothetical protein